MNGEGWSGTRAQEALGLVLWAVRVVAGSSIWESAIKTWQKCGVDCGAGERMRQCSGTRRECRGGPRLLVAVTGTDSKREWQVPWEEDVKG